MSGAEVVRIEFLFNSNITQFTGALERAQAEAVKLEAQMSRLGTKGLKGIHDQFATTLKASGQWQVSTINNIHATRDWGNQLAAQKLSLREATREMVRYGKAGTMVSRVARENLRMRESIILSSRPGPGGTVMNSIATPQEASLEGVANKALYAEERFKAWNASMKNASTSLVNLGKNTQWAGRQMMVGMTLPIAALGATAAMTFKKVDEELVRISKVYGDSLSGKNINIAEVRKNAMDVASEIAREYGVAIEETLALTADLAAVGYTGDKLESSVKETTRLALLGEVDRQQAMKTTLSLQTAFSLNTKQLTEAINFLNAAENATSTSLQDMTEAIPRAGTVVKALGGDVEDLTVFITAMREGGINAAEGANALKSGLASIITPAKEASNYVKQYGIDLNGIVDAGAGDLMKTLLLFQEQLQKLDKISQQRVISKLFGKFQMGRMTALFENLNKKGSQTKTVLDLMGYSAQKMARMADTEIARTAESASGRMKRAFQTLRADLAAMGEEFLKIGTWFLEIGDKILSWFNGLEQSTKKWITWLVLAAAATGPLVMIAGILENWVGHIGNFFRLMIAGAAKMRGMGTSFKMYTEDDMAKELGATIKTGMYDAKLATEALNRALDEMNSKLLALKNNAAINATGVSLGGTIQWGKMQGDRLNSPGLGIESKQFNRNLGNKDPRPMYGQMLLGEHQNMGDNGKQAVIQKLATEAAFYDFTKGGLTPEQRKLLTSRAGEIGTEIEKIKGGQVTQAGFQKLNSTLEQAFPGITQAFEEHVRKITAQVEAAAAKAEPGARRAASEEIVQQGIIKSSVNSVALAGTRAGGRDSSSGILAQFGLAGLGTRILDSTPAVDPNTGKVIEGMYDNSAPTLAEAAKNQIELEAGHLAPDSKAQAIVEAVAVATEQEYEQQKALLEQQTAELEKRRAALARLAKVDEDNAATGNKLSKHQTSAAKKNIIQSDEYMKENIKSVTNIGKFADETEKQAAVQQKQTEVVEKATVERQKVNDLIRNLEDDELMIEQRTREAEKQQEMEARKRANAARRNRIIGGAGMALSMLPMMTSFMGDFGDKIAPISMGASMGMMAGPYGALAGAGAGAGLQLFKYLQDQSNDVSEALQMSTISADIFGKKLRSVADANVDDFIKSMTNNAKAASEAAEAMKKFTEAIANAPEGSPERATLDRLKDLSGGNSAWETIAGFISRIGSGQSPFNMMGGDKVYNRTPGAETGAVLTQRYATSRLGGANENQALGEVGAYANMTGTTYSLKLIKEDLKAIKNDKDVIRALSDQVKSLAAEGQDTKEVFRDVINQDVLAQLSNKDLPEVKAALDAANMSWEDYAEAMRNGSTGQKQFAADLDNIVQTLNVDVASAIAIVIARLNGLDVAANNFANKSYAEVMFIIDQLEQQDKLTGGIRKALNKYNKKNSKDTGSVEAVQKDAEATMDAAKEASDAEIKAMEETAKKRQEAMQKAIEDTQKEYDAKIKAIQKENEVKQDAFDKDQERIQRAKDARASEIDYLRAMSEGRYYDAAAIKNDMDATRQQNDLEDAQRDKNDKAQMQIEGLTEERDKKIETLNDQLKKQQEHDQKMIEQKREADQKMLDQMQKTEDARLDAVQKTNKKIDKSNKESGVSMKDFLREILSAAQKGEGRLNKVLEKYGVSQKQAMALLVKNAGFSAVDAAKAIGTGLEGADWKSLAKYIEAELDNDPSARKWKGQFFSSLDAKGVQGAVNVRTSLNNPGNPDFPGWTNNPNPLPNSATDPNRKADGGYISGPGTARSDSIPARLSNGEYVINARSVSRVGVGNLNKINQQGKLPGFAEGGLVPDGRGIANSVTRVATWDYINSLVDRRIQEAKEAAENGGSMVDSKGFTLDGVPTGEWGKPGPYSWTTYDFSRHGWARDYQPPTIRLGYPVYSVGPGKVAGMNDGVKDQPFGVSAGANSPSNWVLIWHKKKGKKYSTYYQHLMKNSVKVKPGDVVDHETMIARMGNSGNTTGPHLHFEVREGWNDRYTGPWNAEIQSIWNLVKGGLIGQEGNPVPDGTPLRAPTDKTMGLISGYTDTQLKEHIDIYSKLGMSKKKAVESAQKDSNSIAVMGDKKSPEAARAFAKSILGRYGWSGQKQWKALLNLWNRESGWKWYADNPTSDAYGIPQSLPGSKMRSAGADWKTNPETQIKWGLRYIKDRYGSPLGAWGHSERNGWYADGGLVIPGLRKGATINYDNTLANLHRGESVLTQPLTKKLKDGVGVASGGDVIYNVDITLKENMSQKQAEDMVFSALHRHTARVGRG